MNIQSSSQRPPSSPSDTSGLRLQEIEKATQKAKVGVVGCTLAAVATYLVSGWTSDPTSSLMFQASIVSLVVGVIYAGRWSLARQLESQVQIRQLKEIIDWSEIPEGGFAQEIRFYASLEEAQERGWKVGPAAGVFRGNEVPGWIEMEGARFFFDGLISPKGTSLVPENVRVVGRLRFIMPEEQASNETPQEAA